MWRSQGALGAMVVCLVSSSSACRQQATRDPPAPAPPTKPKQLTISALSVAVFDHDDLVECEDFEVGGTPNPDADLNALTAEVKKRADDVWKGLSKQQGSRESTRLQRSCIDQFRDRKAFATCSMVADNAVVRAKWSYYSFPNVFRNDGAMKECIKSKGTWEALSRESDEFREAQLRFDTLDAQKQFKRLMPKSE